MQPELTQFIREKPELAKELLCEFYSKEKLMSIDAFIDTHAKQPILTTEDGVDVFSTDTTLFCIKKEDWVFYNTRVDTDYMRENFIHFSSAESRREYYIRKKPLTSVKEQVEAIKALNTSNGFPTLPDWQIEGIEEVLTELAKSKVG